MDKIKILIKAVFWWLINNFFLLFFSGNEEQGYYYLVKYKCKACNDEYIAIVPVLVVEEDFLLFCPNCHDFTEHFYLILTQDD